MVPASGNTPWHSDLPSNADSRLATLLAFWLTARDHTHDVPNREQFTPFTLRPWLGYISIYEAVDQGRDFYNRLEGTRITGITGEDWTHRRASEVDARFGSNLVADMTKSIARGAPQIHAIRIFQHEFKTATRLLLPVRTALDSPVNQVLLALYLDNPAVG